MHRSGAPHFVRTTLQIGGDRGGTVERMGRPQLIMPSGPFSELCIMIVRATLQVDANRSGTIERREFVRLMARNQFDARRAHVGFTRAFPAADLA